VKEIEVLIVESFPVPSKALAANPNPKPFLGTLKGEEIHSLEFPFAFKEDLSPYVGHTFNHPIQQRSLASLTPNHHLLYSSQDLVTQELRHLKILTMYSQYAGLI